MKWFKHITDSLDDPFIFDLLQRFGGDGYLVFFGVLEIYAREFKTDPKWRLSVTENYLKKKLAKRQWTVIRKILAAINYSGKWQVIFPGVSDEFAASSPGVYDEFDFKNETPGKLPANSRQTQKNSVQNHDEQHLYIYIPKFRELLDETTLKKLRDRERSFRNYSGTLPKTEGTDKEVDKEVDKDLTGERETDNSSYARAGAEDETCFEDFNPPNTPQGNPPASPRNQKLPFGEFQNVMMTQTEFDRLVERYGDGRTREQIEELSGAIRSKGLRYKDHYATVQNWIKRKGSPERGPRSGHRVESVVFGAERWLQAKQGGSRETRESGQICGADGENGGGPQDE